MAMSGSVRLIVIEEPVTGAVEGVGFRVGSDSLTVLLKVGSDSLTFPGN